MSKEAYISREFPIKCSGRDSDGVEVLETPINVSVEVHQHPGDETNIHMDPINCPYNAGSHRQRCEASGKGHPNAKCVYSIDIPHALEYFKRPINF